MMKQHDDAMSAFTFRKCADDELFDPLTISPDALFTQASFYGVWQKSIGREVERFVVMNEERAVAYFQIITYPLMFGKRYLYIPYGPVVRVFSEEFFVSLKKELSAIAQKKKAVFVRLDFTPPAESGEHTKPLEQFFVRAPLATYHGAYFQPRAEWVLDVDGTEEELLEKMHEKTRYCIRLAERRGVVTEIVSSDFEEHFRIFYELMLDTARRNGFRLHTEEYYRAIFRTLTPENAFFSIARYENTVVAFDVIIIFGATAHYVFGASSSLFRSVCASHAAQWSAIKHAKQIGCVRYSFGGIAWGNVYKGWDGLTSFKKKFGGREVVHSVFFDVVVQPIWYWLYVARKFIKNILHI